MKFLQELFREELDCEGSVVVYGHQFAPSRVLSELDPSLFDAAFESWAEQRNDRLDKVGNDILSLHDNRARFERLREVFGLGQLCPFVGAGMSIPSGLPGWTQFLRNLRRETAFDETELEDLLAAGAYEEAAERLYQELGPHGFDEALQNTFEATPASPLGPVNRLPHLFPQGPVYTTNFDKVIERSYQAEIGDVFTATISGAGISEVTRRAGMGEHVLVKMHGRCDQVSDRVVTQTEYNQAYEDEGVVRDFILRGLFRQPLLFLGCSLATDRTIGWMKRIVAEGEPANLVRHFAFVHLSDGADKVSRRRELTEAHVFPIWYEQDDHDEAIEALLHLLEAKDD